MLLFDVFIALAMVLSMITAMTAGVPIGMRPDSFLFNVKPYWYLFFACVMAGIKICIVRPTRFCTGFFGGGGFEITELQSLLLGIIFAALGLIVLILGLRYYT